MNDNLGYIGTEVEMLYGKRVLSLKLLNYDSLYYAVIGVIHSVPNYMYMNLIYNSTDSRRHPTHLKLLTNFLSL